MFIKALIVTICLAVRAEEHCPEAIKQYFECSSKAKGVVDEELQNFLRFSNGIEKCFNAHPCVDADVPPPSTAAQPSDAELKEKANSAQETCWSEIFNLPTSLLKPIKPLSELPDNYIIIDSVLGAGNGTIYEEIAANVQRSIEDLTAAAKCSPEDLAEIKHCISELVDASGRPKIAVTTEAEAENRFNSFCNEHKHCLNIIPESCTTALKERESKFCSCFTEKFRKLLALPNTQLDAEPMVLISNPEICDSFTEVMFCRESFNDVRADYDIVDF
ncbi:unnamed protein product [Soboliphyme baturini]|uniref:Secreted protein n=1 Tax=Soboliphyme baturini TaxID=241478 RepID=A0A183IGS3_9BILA|nr:unnamed protein product [Soboliphyme baturini]